MKARRFVESVLGLAIMTVAFWAAGAGTASAQFSQFPAGCGGEGPPCLCDSNPDTSAPACPTPTCPPCESEICPPPSACTLAPTCVAFDEESDACTSEIALFTPENDSWTYVFDANNSIKISTPVITPFLLKVDRIPIEKDTEYKRRVANTPFSESECHPTLVPGEECNFYRVHGEFVPRDSYGEVVEYIVGFLLPGVQGNKHDWMLLRDPHSRFLGDTETLLPDDRFCQEITTKVIRNYQVPDSPIPDPGVGGVALGMSDYIVAHQRLRPASKRRVDPTCAVDPEQ